jgi:hypothetical protein
VFVQIAGLKSEEVMRGTWGHLDAKPNVKHPGTIVFAESAYGHLVILSADFGDDAGDGPWFYQHVHEWLDEQDTERGTCYRFTGWYRHDGNGTHDFVGDITPVPLTE